MRISCNKTLWNRKAFFIISTGNACDVKFQQKSFVKAMSIFVFYENNVIPAKSWLNKLWEISYLHVFETYSGRGPTNPSSPTIVTFMSGISIKCLKHITIYLFFCEVLYLKYKSNGFNSIHATLLLNTNIFKWHKIYFVWHM